jgi:hypothetical protein
MAYSSFKKLKTVVNKFGLNSFRVELFPETIINVEPSDFLLMSLRKARKMPITNEKSKSERILSPILMEVAEAFEDSISLFSGEDLSVENNQDLQGECDFFFSLHPPKDYIEAPIISLTEAKDENMEYGIAQCAAQMYGAKLFNEQEGRKDITVIYGCATTGDEWQFLKLENNIVYIDRTPRTHLPEILGIWKMIISSYL